MSDYRIYFFVVMLVACPPLPAVTLSTWAPWEIDTVVTAWYLKRHVMPEVKFQSLAKGTLIDHNASIDIPDSPYRRDAKNTALDSAIKIHSTSFACIEKLTYMVRLLELAPWRKSISPDAELFEQEILPMLPKRPMVGGLDPAFSYLDEFCVHEDRE